MKFLKLQLTDFELYSLEGSTRKAEYLFSNMPAFRRFYSDQGEIFWIRHLLMLREYLHVLIQARFEIEAKQCLHWILIPVDKILIRVHKLIFVGGFDTAKENIKIMKKVFSKLDMLPSIIGNRNCRFILSKSIKNSFRTLFGTHLGHDKKAIFKAFLTCNVYEVFIGTLGVLLRRSDTAVEMPSSYSDESPNVQYWQPFSYWKNNDYEPNAFETYIAQHYGEKLQTMLLIKNIHDVFQRNTIHQCCISFIEEYGTVLMNEHSSNRLKKEYAFCSEHRNCRLRISHSEKCKNPYFKCFEPDCAMLCDTLCMEARILLCGKNKGFAEWKCQSISTHKNSRKHRRDVAIQVESVYSEVETYVYRHSARCVCSSDESSDSPHFFQSLPPDLINFAKQAKQKEKTKSRLRDKLSKKTKKNGKIEDILHCYPIENSEYYSNLFKRAQKKINEELGEDFLYKYFGFKVGQSDAPLLDIFDTPIEIEMLNIGHSPVSVNSNYKSIAVGNDVPLDFRFVSIPKVIHVKKRLKGLFNMRISKKENMHTSDILKKMDEEARSAEVLVNEVNEETKFTVDKNSDDEKSETVNLEKQENSVKSKKHKKSKRNGKKCKKKDAENAVEEIIIKNNKQDKSSEIHKNIEPEKISDMQNSTSSSEDKVIAAEVERKELKSTENAAVQTNFEYSSHDMCEESNRELTVGAEKISGLDELVSSKENGYSENDLQIGITTSSKQDFTITNDTIIDKKENNTDLLQETDKNKTEEQRTSDEIKLERDVRESPGLHSDKIMSDVGKDLETNLETAADEKVKNVQLINKKKASKLNFCSNCGKEEPARRTFQKCKLCKEHHFEVQRYYCSIECQANDWKLKHKEEHKNRNCIQ